MCWHGGVLSLDEYIREVADIRKIMLEEFQKEEEDCVYGLVLHFRDGRDLTSYGIYSEVFKHFQSVEGYIIQQQAFLFDEPMDDRAFWEVTKYQLCNGEYQKQLACWFSADMTLLGVRPLAYGEAGYKYLLSAPKNIDVPYRTGDILKINAAPFGKDFYVVYGGEEYRGQWEEGLRNKWDQFYHLCIYEPQDEDGLWIDDLSGDMFTDYVPFPNCPLIYCELAEDCPDLKLNEISCKLKENPDLWYDWVGSCENPDLWCN